MPNRILKETINESRMLSQISTFTQDFYKRLITYADDYGRFNCDPQIILARLYPREIDVIDSIDIMGELIELVGIGKIGLYHCKVHPNDAYGFFPNWSEHQRIRDSKRKCPDPDEMINDWALRRFVPMELKVHIYERDNFKCQECNKSFKMADIPTKKAFKLLNGALHVDHIVPVKIGGRATAENLRILCATCNLKRKRDITFDDLLQFAQDEDKSFKVAAACGELPPNPIQSNPNPNPNPIQSNKKTYASNVKMREDEYLKLCEEFGEAMILDKIEDLNNWKGGKGKTTKDDYLTIRAWIRKDKKQIPINKSKPPDNTTIAW